MKTYMLTMPRKDTQKQAMTLMKWFRRNDIHKWILGAEKGANGYEHWQIRMQWRGEFEDLKRIFPRAHIEECSDTWTYETKEGFYWTSWDRKETRQQRFGRLRPVQEDALKRLRATNDREIMVWVDYHGNVGKSWFTGALWERGQAYVTPPTIDTVKGIIQWVASCYSEGGWRPYIIIDIPRSWKWSDQLYCAIESIKDGLIYDTRYHSRMINIRGVKVLVMTNSMPKPGKLSLDRWYIYETMFVGNQPYLWGPKPMDIEPNAGEAGGPSA